MIQLSWRLLAACMIALIAVGTSGVRPDSAEAGVSAWHDDARRPMNWDWAGSRDAADPWVKDARRPGDWIGRDGRSMGADPWLRDGRRPGDWMVDRRGRSAGPDAWRDDFRRPMNWSWGPGMDSEDVWKEDDRRPGRFFRASAPAPAPVVAAPPGDADRDGVTDDRDRCPDTPRGAEVDSRGCPRDSDGDGVYDGLDRCPDTPRGAEVDARGCARDDDNDGVPNGIDRCPGTPRGVKVDRQGCPQVDKKKEEELLNTGTLRLQGVYFDLNKATIKPESHKALDEAGAILGKWAELRVEVGGHTDSQGSEAYNQSLSERRAAAVRTYLVDKFPRIKGSQLTSRGYGESKPVVGNDTEAGRAKNRRVEFKVLNSGVLRK